MLFFFSFFASLRSYVEYGSPWMLFFAALVQPLATAVLLTLLLSLYAKINPEILNNNSVRQFYSTVRVFGFAALFLSSPLALLCAFGAIQRATFPLDSIASVCPEI